MPFSRAEFFSVFARYNEAVWPAQIVLYLLAILAVVLAWQRSSGATRTVYGILAVFWSWMAVMYHASFFAAINPAATGFSVLFLVQSVVFVALAAARRPPRIELVRATWSIPGAALIAVALVFYPLLNLILGHSYPAQPTFGLPCPTTIFTLGILLLSRELRRIVFAIPLIWAAIGSIGAFALGVPEDLTLIVAFITVVTARSLSAMRATEKVVHA